MAPKMIIKSYFGNCNSTRAASLFFQSFSPTYHYTFALLSDFHKDFNSTTNSYITSGRTVSAEQDHRLNNCIVFPKKVRLNHVHHESHTVAMLAVNNYNVLLIAVYIHYKKTPRMFNMCLADIKKTIDTANCDLVLIGGDFNANSLDNISNSDTHAKGRCLISWIEENGYFSSSCDNGQHSFTHTSGEVFRLDHLIVKCKKNITKYEESVETIQGCDHQMQCAIIHFEYTPNDEYYVIFRPNKFESAEFSESYDNIQQLENTAKMLEDKMGNRCIKQRPIRWQSKYVNPLHNLLNNNKHLPPLFLNNIMKKLSEISKINHREKIANFKHLCKDSPWKVIDKVIKNKLKMIKPIELSAKLQEKETNKQIIYSDYAPPRKPRLCIHHRTECPETISRDQVYSLFKKHSNRSKIGLSGSAIAANNTIIDQYTRVINACLRWGHFPFSWSIGWLTLIPKSDLVKWRQIVSQHSASLVLQEIVNKSLIKYIETKQETDLADQFGFMKNRSIKELIFRFAAKVNEMTKRGHFYLIVDVDVDAAFDSLPHDEIENRLNEADIPHNITSLIMCYIRNFRVLTLIGPEFRERKIKKGVPQGSILGPSIWTIFTAFILKELKQKEWYAKVNLFMYADDLKIVTFDYELVNQIHMVLKDINDVLSHFGLKINPSKTNIYANRLHKQVEAILQANGLRLAKEISIFGLFFSLQTQQSFRMYAIRRKCCRLNDSFAPFSATLNTVHTKLPKLILRSVIMASFSHLFPAMTLDVKLADFWKNVHEIEIDFCLKCFKRGAMSRHALPFVYTTDVASKFVKSEILAMCKDYAKYKEHSIFREFPSLANLCSKLYCKKGIQSDRITIDSSNLEEAEHILVKTNGSNKELQFIIKSKGLKGTIKCHEQSSNFDVMRLGIDAIILFAKALKTSKIQIVSCDQSLKNIGKIYQFWHDSSENLRVNIKILPEECKNEVNNIFYNINNFPIVVTYQRHVGWTSIVKEVNEIIENTVCNFWDSLKVAFTNRVSYRLWKELNRSKFPVKKLAAMRLLCGFVYRRNYKMCGCTNSSLFHLITECPETMSFRLQAEPELQTYLSLAISENILKETKDLELLNMLIIYLYSIFVHFLDKIRKRFPRPFIN